MGSFSLRARRYRAPVACRCVAGKPVFSHLDELISATLGDAENAGRIAGGRKSACDLDGHNSMLSGDGRRWTYSDPGHRMRDFFRRRGDGIQ